MARCHLAIFARTHSADCGYKHFAVPRRFQWQLLIPFVSSNSRGQPEAMPTERQRSIAFAGSRENRVRHRGHKRYGTNFPSAAESFGAAAYDVHLDGRRFVHLRDLIVMKVRFDRATVLKSNV